jgi:hypothetical protein
MQNDITGERQENMEELHKASESKSFWGSNSNQYKGFVLSNVFQSKT